MDLKSGEVVATYEYEVGDRGDALLQVQLQALEAQLQALSVDEFRAALDAC